MERIPPEILSKIFVSEPLITSHVCYRWRAICIGNPGLWDSPILNITTTTRTTYLQLISLWLTRSSTQPLHITLTMDPFSQPPPESRMLAIAAFVLFTQHISRWESIDLALPADALFSTFCATISIGPAASILRSAHISLGNWSGNGEGARSLLAHSPALQELHWSSRRVHGAFDTSYASGIDGLVHSGCWRHLARLALDTLLTLNGVLSIFAQAIRLEYLKLGCFSSKPLESSDSALGRPAAPLAVPCLRTLIVYQQTLDTALPALLEHVVCSGLAQLTIACGFLPFDSSAQTPRAAGPALATFISHTRLETLALKGTGISAGHLFSCLAAAPQLQRLSVHTPVGGGCTVDDALLSALTVRGPAAEQSPLLSPGLRELFLHRGVICSDGACADMVRSRVAMLSVGGDGISNTRTEGVQRLRVIDVDFTKQQHTTNSLDVAYFRELWASGKYRAPQWW